MSEELSQDTNLQSLVMAVVDSADTTNSTLKSTSISQSTSFSSIKSDDDYQSTTSEQPQQKQEVEQPVVEETTVKQDEIVQINSNENNEQKRVKPEALPQRTNITLNLNVPVITDVKQTDSPSKSTVRYSKEFLERVRKERSKFIEQIYPDIFKAYCYCMNGKYWNPEKYFDVVQHQFPDELDKIKKFNRKPLNAQGKPNGSYQSHQQQQQQQPKQQKQTTKKHRKSANDSSNGQKKHQQDQQQQQQHSNADKILLDLIKPKAVPQAQQQPSILDKLLMAPPKTPTKEFELPKRTVLPPLISTQPPPAPPSTPSTNLLDLLNNKKQTSHAEQNTNAYKKLLTYLNPQQQQQQESVKNENIIKKLFDQQTQQPSTESSTKFPLMNPHELPFQSIDYALNQILKSTSTTSSSVTSSIESSSSCPSTTSSSTTTSPHKIIDNLIEKLKSKEQQQQQQTSSTSEHFNLLLSKITTPKHTQTTDILKWFTQPEAQPQLAKLPENAHVFTLKDIESAY